MRGEGGREVGDRTALGSDPGEQEDRGGISSRRRASRSGRVAPVTAPTADSPLSPSRGAPELRDHSGERFVERVLRRRQILEIGGARGSRC